MPCAAISSNWVGKYVKCMPIKTLVSFKFLFRLNNNLIGVFISIAELLFTLTLLFVSCELGNRMSNEFEYINDQIHQFDWHMLSLETQQLLPIITMSVDQPIGIPCIGSIMCNLNTFKTVRICTKIWSSETNWFLFIFQTFNCAFSNFITLRAFRWNMKKNGSIWFLAFFFFLVFFVTAPNTFIQFTLQYWSFIE